MLTAIKRAICAINEPNKRKTSIKQHIYFKMFAVLVRPKAPYSLYMYNLSSRSSGMAFGVVSSFFIYFFVPANQRRKNNKRWQAFDLQN